MEMSVIVKLTKPITAHAEEVSELTLREPTTEDIIDTGLPMLMIVGDGDTTGVEIRQKVVAKYISKLAAIPLSSVRSLSMADYSACSAAVMGFFGSGEPEQTPSSPSASST